MYNYYTEVVLKLNMLKQAEYILKTVWLCSR